MKSRFKHANEIKVGVIGYGGAFNMGRMHLQDMQKAGMTPCAVAEPDAARLAVAAQEFPGIRTFSRVEDMLAQSDVNLVVLITPHNTHAPLALQCLKAGRHVVCEKPFAITTKECDAMIAAAKRAGVMVSTFHNRHWDGSIMAILLIGRSSGFFGRRIMQIEFGVFERIGTCPNGPHKSRSGREDNLIESNLNGRSFTVHKSCPPQIRVSAIATIKHKLFVAIPRVI